MTLRRVTDLESSNNITISILTLRGAYHAFRTSINSLLYNFLSVIKLNVDNFCGKWSVFFLQLINLVLDCR